MKFKIGDRVRIKSWKQLKKEFGSNANGEIPCMGYFSKPMKDLCGTEFIIESIHQDGKFKQINEIKGWFITTDMVTLVSRPSKEDLISNYDLKIVVNSKGLDYTILNYCSGSDLRDKEMRKLFNKAQKVLSEIQNKLEQAEEE